MDDEIKRKLMEMTGASAEIVDRFAEHADEDRETARDFVKRSRTNAVGIAITQEMFSNDGDAAGLVPNGAAMAGFMLAKTLIPVSLMVEMDGAAEFVLELSTIVAGLAMCWAEEHGYIDAEKVDTTKAEAAIAQMVAKGMVI